MRKSASGYFDAPSRRAVLAGLAATPLVSFAGAAALRPVRVRIDDDVQVLDPAFQAGGAEEVVNRAVLMTLTRLAPGGGWKPYAAQEIRARDARTIAFTLRPDLFWSNGFGSLTAEDVKFSFERIADPHQNSPWYYVWSALDRVEVTGAQSGVIHLRRDYSPIWLSALPSWAGHIVCKRAVLAMGGRYAARVPACCGPYIIGEWLPKRRIRLAPNPAWRGAPPPVSNIDLVVVEDTGAAELAFEAGELDITDIDMLSVARYRKSRPPGARLVQPRGSGFTWLGMNVENPKLRDIRVRRAIQYAVDVNAILYAAYGGALPRATGLIPPGILGARTRNLIARRDPEKSRALLRAAGQAQGLSLTLTVINTSFWLTMAQIIQDNLRDVGIAVEILDYDPSVFWSLGVASPGQRGRDIELKLMTIPGGQDPSEFTIWFTSEQIGQYNWERLSDPVIDRMNAQAVAISDPTQRAALYRAIQDRLEESGAFLFIANDARPYLLAQGYDLGFAGDDMLRPDLIRRLPLAKPAAM
ncbi:MAG TPA: ABC transporter substrate-binding protein [Rhizomicrobium sp.]